MSIEPDDLDEFVALLRRAKVAYDNGERELAISLVGPVVVNHWDEKRRGT